MCVCVCVCVCFQKRGHDENQLTWEFLAIWKDSQTCKIQRDSWHCSVKESKCEISQNFFSAPSCLHSHLGKQWSVLEYVYPWCWVWASQCPCRLPTPPDASMSPAGAETKFVGRYLNLTSPRNLHSVCPLGLGRRSLALPAPWGLTGLREHLEPLLQLSAWLKAEWLRSAQQVSR